MKQLSTFPILLFLSLLLSSCNNDNTDTTEIPIIKELESTGEITGKSIIFNKSLLDNGYVLVPEMTNNRVYLITKEKGEIVYEWNLPQNLGVDAELMPDGKLIVALKTENSTYENLAGSGGRIQIINPNGSINSDFKYSNEKYMQHHDVELLPNGNVLMIAWQTKTIMEAKKAGFNKSEELNTFLFPETIIEINPQNENIVWEWNSWDHMVQDFDPSQNNYGNISQNPQLINVNYHKNINGDFMHANGLDYDSDKDIIYLSINAYNEIWVIDHSTNMLESASNSGGQFNKGGDLIYRFGNPLAYENEQGPKMFDKNHFPNLLEGNVFGKGNMLVYVNGNSTRQSKVYELILPKTMSLLPNTNNEPQIVWEFKHPDFFAGALGGAVRLPNGNTLFSEGTFGLWEVTNTGEVVWQFENGLRIWRGYSYPKDHTGIQELINALSL